MSKLSRCILFLVVTMCLSCGGGSGAGAANNFSVVAFSDLHFNPFYDPSLFSALNSADASQWESIFKTSSLTAPSTWGNDTNYPSLVLALAGIKQNLGASPYVIYTGDLLGHYFPKNFFKYYGSQDIAAMQAFSDKTVTFITTQIRSSLGNIPVLFALGNIDSYTGYGPDATFLSHTAETFYTQFLNSSVDHQTFLDSFTSGGYYSADLPGRKLTVIGLNTTPLSPLVPGNQAPNNNDVVVSTQLAWLDSRLTAAKAAGRKVWLIMHVPPGADTVTTSTTAADFDSNGRLTTAAMMWVEAYQDNFLQILAKHPGLITLTLGAHTHMDEYRILSSNNVLDEVPAISPAFGNDPAFKVFTFTGDTSTPMDYTSFTYNLAAAPAQFSALYTFSAAYSMQGPLQSSLVQLYPQIVSNSGKQVLYQGVYTSGNIVGSAITSTNWPLFECGIDKMKQQEFVDCVNSH